MYLASEVTAERHLPCEAISRYCPPAVSLDQGEGTLAKLFVVRAPIQFPKKAPAQMGMSRGLEVTFGEPEGVGKTWQKPRCSWLGRIPAAQNVNGAGVAPSWTPIGRASAVWNSHTQGRFRTWLGTSMSRPACVMRWRSRSHETEACPEAPASLRPPARCWGLHGQRIQRWVPMPIRFWASCWRQPSCTSFLFISRFPGSVA